MLTAISKHGVSGVVKIEPEDDEIIFLSEPPPQKKQRVQPIGDNDSTTVTPVTATATATATAALASCVIEPGSSSLVDSSSATVQQTTRRMGLPLPSFQRRISAQVVPEPNPTSSIDSVISSTTGSLPVSNSSAQTAPQTRPASLLSRIRPSVTLPVVYVPTPAAPTLTPANPAVSSSPTTKRLLQKPLSPNLRPTDPRRTVRPRQTTEQTPTVLSAQRVSSFGARAANPKSSPVAPAVRPVLPVSQPAPPLLSQPTESIHLDVDQSKPTSNRKPKAKVTNTAVARPPSFNTPLSGMHSSPSVPPNLSSSTPAFALPVEMSVFPNPDAPLYLPKAPNSQFELDPHLSFPPDNQVTDTHSGPIAAYDNHNTYPFGAPPSQYVAQPFYTGHNFPPVSQQQFGHPLFQSCLESSQSVFPSQTVYPVQQRTFHDHVHPNVPSPAQIQSNTTLSRLQQDPQPKEQTLLEVSAPITHSSVSGSSYPSRAVQRQSVRLAQPSMKDAQQHSTRHTSTQASFVAKPVHKNPSSHQEKTIPVRSKKKKQAVTPKKPPQVPNVKSPDTVVTEIGPGKLPVTVQQSKEDRIDMRTEPRNFADLSNQHVVTGRKPNEPLQVASASKSGRQGPDHSVETRDHLMAIDLVIDAPQKKLNVDELKHESNPELRPKLNTKAGVGSKAESRVEAEGEVPPGLKDKKSLQERLAGERRLVEANKSKSDLPAPSTSLQSKPVETGKLFDKPNTFALITTTASSPPRSIVSSSSVPAQSSINAVPAIPSGSSKKSKSDYRHRPFFSSHYVPTRSPSISPAVPPRRDTRPYRNSHLFSSPPRRHKYHRDWQPNSPPHLRRESIPVRIRGRSPSPSSLPSRSRSRSPVYNRHMVDRYEPRLREYRRSPSYLPSSSPPPLSRMRRDISPPRDPVWSSTRRSRSPAPFTRRSRSPVSHMRRLRSPVPYIRRSPPRRSLVNRVAPFNRFQPRTRSPPRSRIHDDRLRAETGVKVAGLQTSFDSRPSQIPTSFRNNSPDRPEYRSGLFNASKFDERVSERGTRRDWELNRREELDRDRVWVAATETRQHEARQRAIEQRRHREAMQEREREQVRLETIELERMKNREQKTALSAASYPVGPVSVRQKISLQQTNKPRPWISEANATFCPPTAGTRESFMIHLVAQPATEDSNKTSMNPTGPQPSEDNPDQGNLARVDPDDLLIDSSSHSFESLNTSSANVLPEAQASFVTDCPPPSDNQPEVDEVEFLLDEDDDWCVTQPLSDNNNNNDWKKDREMHQPNISSGKPVTPSTLVSPSPLFNQSSSEGLLNDSVRSATDEPIKKRLFGLSSSPAPEKRKRKKKFKTKTINENRNGNDNPLGHNNNNNNKIKNDQTNQIHNKNKNNKNDKRLGSNSMVTNPAIPARSLDVSSPAPVSYVSTIPTPPPINSSPVASIVADEPPILSPRVNPLLVRLTSTESAHPSRRSLLDRAGILPVRSINEESQGWASPSSLIERLWNRRSR